MPYHLFLDSKYDTQSWSGKHDSFRGVCYGDMTLSGWEVLKERPMYIFQNFAFNPALLLLNGFF